MSRPLIALTIGFCLVSAAGGAAWGNDAVKIRAGMIGLDTSHVPAFTKILNQADDETYAGIRVVAGYPGGTDIPASRDRVEGFTNQQRDMGVEIVDTIPALLERVDVVLLESVDGRIHLEEAIPVILAGKPLFIDKPVAGSLADAIAIYELAKKHDVPVFSCSSLRYSPAIQSLRDDPELGDVVGTFVWGSCSYQAGTPDLFFYGIHGVEMLYTLMGTGCQTLTRAQTDDTDVVTGTWNDGRLATYRGIRKHKSGFGAVAFGTKAIKSVERDGSYRELIEQVATFFVSGQSPVAAEETIELVAFMEAADESKRQGGQPVQIADVMATAEAEAAKRLEALLPPSQ